MTHLCNVGDSPLSVIEFEDNKLTRLGMLILGEHHDQECKFTRFLIKASVIDNHSTFIVFLRDEYSLLLFIRLLCVEKRKCYRFLIF